MTASDEISVPPTPMTLVREGKAVFAVPERDLPPPSPEDVRATLEQVRR